MFFLYIFSEKISTTRIDGRRCARVQLRIILPNIFNASVDALLRHKLVRHRQMKPACRQIIM